MHDEFEETADQRLARYRSLAAKARQTAEKVRSDDVRAGYLDLARSWDDLAAELQRKQRSAPASPPPAQRSFDVNDQPKCGQCGGGTTLIRRTPHPELGVMYELQTFACSQCGHAQSRNLKWPGE
jgi:hypothetical protein